MGQVQGLQGPWGDLVGLCVLPVEGPLLRYFVWSLREDGNEGAISDLYMSIGENCRLQRVGLSETMEYYKKSLAITLKLEGQVSAGVASIYHNMALALRELGGDLDKAMEFIQKSLALSMGIFGPDHGDVGIAYQNIALILERQNKPTEARGAIEKSVAIAKAFHGEEHPTTIGIQWQVETINLFTGL